MPQSDRPFRRPQPRRSRIVEPFEDLRCREFRQDVADRLVELQFALLDELHRRDRGHRLGHRSNAKDRVGRAAQHCIDLARLGGTTLRSRAPGEGADRSGRGQRRRRLENFTAGLKSDGHMRFLLLCYLRRGEASFANCEVMSAKVTLSEVLTSITVGSRAASASCNAGFSPAGSSTRTPRQPNARAIAAWSQSLNSAANGPEPCNTQPSALLLKTTV